MTKDDLDAYEASLKKLAAALKRRGAPMSTVARVHDAHLAVEWLRSKLDKK